MKWKSFKTEKRWGWERYFVLWPTRLCGGGTCNWYWLTHLWRKTWYMPAYDDFATAVSTIPVKDHEYDHHYIPL